MKKIIAVIDNSFPQKGDVIITSDLFKSLILLPDTNWKSEVNLKSLIEKLINTNRFKNQEIELFGFMHPTKLIDEIYENSFNPDVIIYDWEYDVGSEDSGDNLLEILNNVDAFTFVYSSFFDAIPATLHKVDFAKVSHRIQLLSKGDRQSSIFSSEEFIIQYILGLFDKNNLIELNNNFIQFNSSGYLEDASDILYLESVLGRSFLMQNLEKMGNEISEDKIEQLFELVNDTLFISKDSKYIISSNNELMNKRYGPLKSLSYKKALKLIGIKGIDTVLNTGIKAIKLN